MSQELISGFSATRQANNQPDQTFVWDAEESNGGLTIAVRYGGGTGTPHSATAFISTGSTTAVTLTPQQQGLATAAVGNVQAAWSNDNRSYVVTFSGLMVQGGVNNIESSDQNGAPGDAAPIIVAAYLAS
jgi:hypothetical protein